ncbi:glycosyltransferase 61 family protein [Falsigemmobacter faecalis]|uniref:glycosyltransferase 61 family protein n=1 Tax=Falsigemmobacter faecalis TaxID=2488730 RepID=UPI00131513AC|nr:glycosyltransferase 61 family protein [Falsigemmobacter faecalis]
MRAHSYARSGRRLRPMMSFRDVTVGPPLAREAPGVAWPQFDRQHAARHLRRGVPVCRAPEACETVGVIEEAVFIGSYDDHFGHIAAESAPRLLQSLQEKAGLPFLYTAAQPVDPRALAPAFAAVTGWFGLSPRQMRFVHQPHRVATLWVAGQGEDVNGPVVSEGYLDLLDAHAFAQGVHVAAPSGVIYIGRHRLAPRLGGHAGEGYLAQCLAELGVQILAPEALSLRDQLLAYAGAERLIFAEGSAVHGRQLLGRAPQAIDILLRRRHWRMAESQLSPRCDALGYVPVSTQVLHYLGEDGKPFVHSGLALYDLPVLMDYFAQIGIDLARVWQQSAWEAARDRAVLAWITGLYDPALPRFARAWNGMGHFEKVLTGAGLQHLISEAREILDKAAWKGSYS